MSNLLRVAINSFALFILSASTAIYAEDKEINNISSRLEFALNNNPKLLFENHPEKNQFEEISNNYEKFKNRFPDAKWIINPKQKVKENEFQLELLISGERSLQNHKFSLEAKQIIEIKSKNGNMIDYRVLSESSILKSLKSPLEVKLSIPNKVLTGSRYDADIILENPLDDNFLSGGLITLDRSKLNTLPSPYINITPLASGGLFKSIQAPFKPGKQTLAALLVHPKGIIAITKIVEVVPTKEDISI